MRKPKNPLHFAVTVGINRYPFFGNLKRARGDADEFAKWLRDPKGGGLDPANVATVIVDEEKEKLPDEIFSQQAVPTSAQVFDALQKFCEKVDAYFKDDKHDANDWYKTRLYFYVSGHGIAPGPKDAALLMANASPNRAGENISCSQVLTVFGKSQLFHEVVIFADCCRERFPENFLGGVPLTFKDRKKGQVLTVLGCATYFGDIALEPTQEAVGEDDDPDKLRGYFTQALLEGLRGQAIDDPTTGEINSNSLARYVRQRVKNLTESRRNPQQPTMEADPAEPVIFRIPKTTKAKTLPKHQVKLKFVTPFQGKALLYDGNIKKIGEHRVADGEWVVKLANGLYQVTAEGGASIFQDGGLFSVLGEEREVEL